MSDDAPLPALTEEEKREIVKAQRSLNYKSNIKSKGQLYRTRRNKKRRTFNG
jgi:hypothetical protein